MSETIIPDVMSEKELFTKILSMRVDETSDIRVGFLMRGINDWDNIKLTKSWHEELSGQFKILRLKSPMMKQELGITLVISKSKPGNY